MNISCDIYCNATAVLKKTQYANKVKTATPRNMIKGVNTVMQNASNVAC